MREGLEGLYKFRRLGGYVSRYVSGTFSGTRRKFWSVFRGYVSTPVKHGSLATLGGPQKNIYPCPCDFHHTWSHMNAKSSSSTQFSHVSGLHEDVGVAEFRRNTWTRKLPFPDLTGRLSQRSLSKALAAKHFVTPVFICLPSWNMLEYKCHPAGI